MSGRVLIVDDMELNRVMLEEILISDYEILQAEDGQKAMDLLKKYGLDISVILLDIFMPVADGYQVLEYMKQEKLLRQIPVLVIGSEINPETEERCFEKGVTDFIRKPFTESQVRQRVHNVVAHFTYKNQLEKEVARQTETVRRQYKLLQAQTEKLRQNNMRMMDILGTVVEHRNLEGTRHILHVREMTGVLGRQVMRTYPEYLLTEQKVQMIAYASTLHDIGKISIPDEILMKPGKLQKEEFDYMKSHTLRGCEIIEQITDIWDEEYTKTIYDICRGHHERYDGKGYPDGLAGEEIPLSAQLVSIVDAYDVLVSERVYKDAFSAEEAFHMVVTGECGVFSPKLLECFRQIRPQLEQILQQTTEERQA